MHRNAKYDRFIKLVSCQHLYVGFVPSKTMCDTWYNSMHTSMNVFRLDHRGPYHTHTHNVFSIQTFLACMNKNYIELRGCNVCGFVDDSFLSFRCCY